MTLAKWVAPLRQRRGYVLVSALIAAGVISSLGVVMLNRATAHTRQMQQSAELDQSWYLAMAGIEECMAKLRWDGTSWTSLMGGGTIVCSGSLNGGSYSAQATKPSGSSNTANIRSDATYGRYARRLIGVVQWNNQTGGGTSSLFAGGNWRFSGNAHIEGNIASTGSIEFAGSSTLCGQAHAHGSITPDPSSPDILPHYQPGCGSIAIANSSLVEEFTGTFPAVYDRTYTPAPPAGKAWGTQTLTCSNTDTNTDCWKQNIRVNGIARIPNLPGSGAFQWKIDQEITVVADGIIIDGPISAYPGRWVNLYAPLTSTYGGSEPCPDYPSGTSSGGVADSTSARPLTMWVNQSEHHDVRMWAKNGMIFFKGSQGGGSAAGVYGKIYGKCVQTSDNWNFYPGADMPGGTCTVGCASSLRLTALYQP